jgi:hypothetical protein
MSQPTAQTKAVFGASARDLAASQAYGAPVRANAVEARGRTGTEVPHADLLPEPAETYSDPDRPFLRRGWRASAMPSLKMERR